VSGQCGGRPVQWEVERLIANVGYAPDTTLFRELQVHECYASEGPMALAAALLKHGGGDCLTQPSGGAATLRCPEPNFFVLGAKSYGRNSAFLLRVGFEQVRDAFALITGKPGLDLYKKRCPMSVPLPLLEAPAPVVSLSHLDELWFQVTGTHCNLTCRHCFISCSPHNHTFGYLGLDDVRRALAE